MRMQWKALVATVVLALSPAPAAAQWILVGPSNYQFYGVQYEYGFSASFACTPGFTAGTSCQTLANGVRVTNGTAWADLTFTGASGTTLTTLSYGPYQVFGAFNLATGGTGDFTWPELGIGDPLFTMSLLLDIPGGSTTGTVTSAWYAISPTAIKNECCAEADPIIKITTPYPPPPGVGYFPYVSLFSEPTLDVNSIPTANLQGQITLIPEPSTYALMAAGLLAMSVVARRRRLV